MFWALVKTKSSKQCLNDFLLMVNLFSGPVQLHRGALRVRLLLSDDQRQSE